MANPYVSGPCHIYVGINNSGYSTGSGSHMADLLTYPGSKSYVKYLGTCETAPQIVVRPSYRHLYADIGGREVPFVSMYTGQDAVISGVLTKWNELVYRQMSSRPNQVSQNDGGITRSAKVGTLMQLEGVPYCYNVWLHFPNSGYGGTNDTPTNTKLYGSSLNLPKGYRFIACWMEGPDVTMPGSRAMKRSINFYASRVYDATNGDWTLYDYDMGWIPIVPPTSSAGTLS